MRRLGLYLIFYCRTGALVLRATRTRLTSVQLTIAPGPVVLDGLAIGVERIVSAWDHFVKCVRERQKFKSSLASTFAFGRPIHFSDLVGLAKCIPYRTDHE